MINIKSYLTNPILVPSKRNKWENKAVFNGCVVKTGRKYRLIYRALAETIINGTKLDLSTIGMATGADKHNFRHRKQLLQPEQPWEQYGLEDPRVTKFFDDYYIFYTALGGFPPNATNIKVAVAVTKDFKTFEKHLVTPFNAKAMVLLPKLINGKMAAILTVNTDAPPATVAIAYFDKHEDIWNEEYWRKWYARLEDHKIELRRMTSDHIEVGAVPVETEDGWLLVYSHIQNYYSKQEMIFGIEAVLLDKNDPQKIIGRTRKPLMIPQEDYELEGMIPNVIFPTGALAENGKLYIYYGAADTTCAMAMCDLDELLDDLKKNPEIPRLNKYNQNPIISPRPELKWESRATFNPAVIYLNNKVHLVYRAMGEENTSVFGYAASNDGMTISERPEEPVYAPSESFELKLKPEGYSGCEDPRLTQIGDRIYMCYTAYDGINPPRIAMSSIYVNDFLNKKWNWAKPKLISKPGVDNKDGCIFPEQINGKYVFCHREGGKGIVIDYLDDLEFEHGEYLESDMCLMLGSSSWDDLKIGVSAPPIKTKAGWLLLYHGVSKNDQNYRVGAMLLDLKDPCRIIGRSQYPLLEPELNYEKFGEVNNVVFPCGAVVIKDKIYVYYGGADKVIGMAQGSLEEIVKDLSRE